MSALGTVYFTKEKLQDLLNKAEKGIALTFSINDETNQYGQNVSFTLSQTKEQRDNKEKKTYIANGSIVWTDGKINVAKKVETNKPKEENSNPFAEDEKDLPF
jgi:hypothetical protein